MNERKLKVIIDRSNSLNTRLVDVQSGETIYCVTSIDLSFSPSNIPVAHFTIMDIDVESVNGRRIDR